MSPGWRNEKHAAQWTATLTTYAYPHFENVPVSEIDTPLVLKAIEPIWTSKTETASRLRGRVEAVLDWSAARGYRSGDNPARWRGHVANLLPKRSNVRKVEHHPALPYVQIPTFMAQLQVIDCTASDCLQFTILTAARTGEAIGASWAEFDSSLTTWTVPAERMKGGRVHRVPLSQPAVDILTRIKATQALLPPVSGDYVFRGLKPGTALSNMAMLALLARMKRDDLTVHGFRSSFRDWAEDNTNYPRSVYEAALAHAIDDKVEAAYRRGDLLVRRKLLMNEWSRYCLTVPRQGKGEVVELRA